MPEHPDREAADELRDLAERAERVDLDFWVGNRRLPPRRILWVLDALEAAEAERDGAREAAALQSSHADEMADRAIAANESAVAAEAEVTRLREERDALRHALKLAWPGIVAGLEGINQDDVTVPIGVAHDAALAALSPSGDGS